MANLIITIISIGLVAVAAIMGIYYGGKAYQQGQINVIASAMINEAAQINAAQRLWATNNNQPDATGVTISGLVTAKDLVVYPGAIIQQLGGTPANQYWGESSSYNYAGATGTIARSVFTYNNGNYVFYFFSRLSGNWSTVSASDPIIQIAAAINSKLGIPSQFALSNGVAHMAGEFALSNTSPNTWFAYGNNNNVSMDANNNLITNLCYYDYNYAHLDCVFGPS